MMRPSRRAFIRSPFRRAHVKKPNPNPRTPILEMLCRYLKNILEVDTGLKRFVLAKKFL
tara:strand:+ start:781 stop:957 length:177 start_codon:yes stop_codon:yes gene_type:complete